MKIKAIQKILFPIEIMNSEVSKLRFKTGVSLFVTTLNNRAIIINAIVMSFPMTEDINEIIEV